MMDLLKTKFGVGRIGWLGLAVLACGFLGLAALPGCGEEKVQAKSK